MVTFCHFCNLVKGTVNKNTIYIFCLGMTNEEPCSYNTGASGHLDCSLCSLNHAIIYSFAAGYTDGHILLASLQNGTDQFNSVIRLYLVVAHVYQMEEPHVNLVIVNFRWFPFKCLLTQAGQSP